MRGMYTAIIAIVFAICCGATGASPISDVKASSPGTAVSIQGALVTASFYGDSLGKYVPVGFAIETPNRSGGIRVVSSQSVKPGDAVTISGSSALASGELVIQASQVSVTSSNNTIPKAVGISGLASGGGGIDGVQNPVVDDSAKGTPGRGLDNVGMLVKLCGKVTASAYTGNYDGYFYIDDGSSIHDGSGNTGIKCRPASNMEYPLPLPNVGDYVVVTGVMGTNNSGGTNARYFWTKSVQTVIGTATVPPLVGVVVFNFGDAASGNIPDRKFTTATDNESSQYSVNYGSGSACISVSDYPRKWRGTCDLGTLYLWGDQLKLYGGEAVDITYSMTSANSPGTNISIICTDYSSISVASGSAFIRDGADHTIHFVIPSNYTGKRVSTIKVTVDNAQAGTTTLCLKQFIMSRDGNVSTRVDADTILKTPPTVEAHVGMQNGAMAMFVDSQPVTGMGWVGMVPQGNSDGELQDMHGDTGFKCARLVVALGEQLYTGPQYAPSWYGPNLFDFRYQDVQMGRIMAANPQTKVILLVVLDGAKWWDWAHPQDNGAQASRGIPDYLSTAWRVDSRDAIRQMVAHVQTSSYKNAVIGYELFNGWSMDCNFEVNDSTPGAIARFRAFLKSKYATTTALRAAWGDSTVTLDTATPEYFIDSAHPSNSSDPMALILEPGRRPRYCDSADFRMHSYQQIIIDFARNIKEATQGKAIVGARTGNFMGNNFYGWPDWSLVPNASARETFPIDELAASPYLDFLDVQESYPGRTFFGESGCSVPVNLPLGLAKMGKLLVIQDDWRSHTGPDRGFGATPDLATTIQTQRRVFANCLTMGMSPYLWQMSYYYNDPSLVAEFAKQQTAYKKSFSCDRSSGAQVAFVYDRDYKDYFGYDPVRNAPSRGFLLFDYSHYTFARAGVPFDMIFLDQLETAGPYKVYVFFHTAGLTDAQISTIRSVVGKNGNVAIFMWADGLIDGKYATTSRMKDLSGINIVRATSSSYNISWQMSPSSYFYNLMGIPSTTPMGTLPTYKGASTYDAGGSDTWTFLPTFYVSDATTTSLATNSKGSVSIAEKNMGTWTSIYTGSGIISPWLLRHAADLAGAFQYTDTDDICYINNSFITVIPKTTGNFTLHFPTPTQLYDVFAATQYTTTPVTSFTGSVTAGQVYVLFRGTKAQWDALP